MACRLFFLDYTFNLVKTYGSGACVKILLTASDERVLFENREYSIHQPTLTRDRGGYLGQPFGRQERMAAYSQLPPSSVRFYSIFGKDLGNIEVVPKPTPAYMTPSSMPAGFDTGFSEPVIPGMCGFETPPIPSSFHPSLDNITDLSESDQIILASRYPGATASMAGYNLGASVDPPPLDSFSDFTDVGNAPMAYMADDMSGMHISAGSGHSFDPHPDYMNQLQHPGQMWNI
uniref:Uncharacterized protein n=1 Tax=Talaromyces marneffei PM1 TaxID=1077442 RepID=A0A093Y012_TALMA